MTASNTKIRVSICLTKAIAGLKNQKDSIINTLFDSACRYGIKFHPINNRVSEDEKMEIEELRENTIYIRFMQLKGHFSIA